MSLPKESIDRLIEIGARFGNSRRPLDGEGDPYIVLPHGYKVESLAHLIDPTRIKRHVTLFEVGSFCDYVKRFKNGNSLIFAHVTENGAVIQAVLDYHGPADEDGPANPARCEHLATYRTLETPDWLLWRTNNVIHMNQVTFATFLEDNLTLFKEPSGSALLELIQNLEGKSDVRFNTALRLTSGANKLSYDEDVVLKGSATTTAGAIELPNIITVGIAPFQGAVKYEIEARLKYRIEGRKLSLWYATIGMEKIIRDSILLLVSEIATKTEITPLIGNPGN